MLRGRTEAVERLGTFLKTAFAVATCKEPIAAARNELWIDVVDFGHVAELKHAVRGEGFVAGVGAPPFEAALFALVTGELGVARREQLLATARHLWVADVVLFQVLQREHVGIVRAGGLLEAAGWLAEHAVHAALERGKRRGVCGERHFERAGDAVGRQLDRDFLLALEPAGVRFGDGESGRYDANGLTLGIGERAGSAADFDRRVAAMADDIAGEVLTLAVARRKIQRVFGCAD